MIWSSILTLVFVFNLQSETDSVVYRSDQFSPGVISEYIEITLSQDKKDFISGAYWSVYRSGDETVESERAQINFKNAQRYSGEEVGVKGQLQLFEKGEWIYFRIAEGVLELDHESIGIQTFEPE